MADEDPIIREAEKLNKLALKTWTNFDKEWEVASGNTDEKFWASRELTVADERVPQLFDPENPNGDLDPSFDPILGDRESLFGGEGYDYQWTSKKQSEVMSKKLPARFAEFDPALQNGAIAPLGFWDPAGFCYKKGETGRVVFRKFRVMELKHGRVAQLASMGVIIQHWVHNLGPDFADIPSGLGVFTSWKAWIGLTGLIAYCGYLELAAWTDNPLRKVGDFGDPWGAGLFVPTENGRVGNPTFRDMEISHGRASMIAMAGIIAADLATGKDAIEQLGFS